MITISLPSALPLPAVERVARLLGHAQRLAHLPAVSVCGHAPTLTVRGGTLRDRVLVADLVDHIIVTEV